jgi:anti-sigma B factor antagonist
MVVKQEKASDLIGGAPTHRGEAFSLAVLARPRQAVLFVGGEFDLAAVGPFTACADRARSVSPQVMVDLSGITFIDSSGLNALLRLRQLVVAGGGALTIGAPADCVRQLFAITGLSEVFGLGA